MSGYFWDGEKISTEEEAANEDRLNALKKMLPFIIGIFAIGVILFIRKK
jgi:hypothetical protein